MKYAYDCSNEEYNELIRKYEIIGDKLIIHYFNGNEKVIDYSKYVEDEILLMMIAQLSILVDSYDINKLIDDSEDYSLKLFINIIYASLNLAVVLSSRSLIVYLTGLLCEVIYLKNMHVLEGKSNKCSQMVNDLKMYKLYLDNRTLFTRLGINCNEIDNYSYKKVKKIVKENEKNVNYCLNGR